MKRLAIVTTHPIQYNAPLFRLLTERGIIQLKVFYTWSQSEDGNLYDPGFGIHKAWDIPLLDGYDYQFSANIAARPGSHHFNGVINPTLNSEVEAYNPDAILLYGWSFRSHLKLLRYFKKRASLYFRGDSTLLNEEAQPTLKKFLRRLALRWVYQRVDHAFYAGEENKKYFLKHGLRETQLSFMPHAIDNNRFAIPHEEEVTALRSFLSILDDHIVFLYAGKFEPVKNPSVLIEAFRAIAAPGVHLVMVGSGVLLDRLKSESSGTSNIHFLPFQNQSRIPVIYQLSDVFVLPSRSETWGLAVNEAMAAGKAVLVSDKCGCAADLVKEGENGFIFQSESATDLSARMAQMVTLEKEGLNTMGQRSRAIICDWTYIHCAEAIETKLNTQKSMKRTGFGGFSGRSADQEVF